MPINDLYDTLHAIRSRISEFSDYLSVDERRTRQLLIDPLLTTLGWDLLDPQQVEIEPRIEHSASSGTPRADYALRNSKERRAYVEAKKLGHPDLARAAEQAAMYANTDGIEYAIVTDGDFWTLYDVFKRVPVPDRKVVEFRVSRDDLVDCALQSLAMWRNNVCEAKTLEPGTSPVIVCRDENGEDWLDLSDPDLEVSGERPPTRLVDHTGVEHPVSKWIAFYTAIANALVEDGKITTSDCPVKLKPGNKKCIIHVEPIHPNGRSFRRKINLSKGLFLEGNVGAWGCYHYARILLQYAGIPLTAVKFTLTPP